MTIGKILAQKERERILKIAERLSQEQLEGKITASQVQEILKAEIAKAASKGNKKLDEIMKKLLKVEL